MSSCQAEQDALSAAALNQLNKQLAVNLAQAAYDADPSETNRLALRLAQLQLTTANATVSAAERALRLCQELNDGGSGGDE